MPVDGQSTDDLIEAALLSSSADDTPEGKSIIDLIQKNTEKIPISSENVTFTPFSAATRVSSAKCGEIIYLKGASDAIIKFVLERGGTVSSDLNAKVNGIASKGGTPLVVARNETILGVIFLKDILKTGIRERFADLRKIGIKTIMITGDNHLTAATIAAEAGVDDYLAEAKPEDKLRMIKEYQNEGYMVAKGRDRTEERPDTQNKPLARNHRYEARTGRCRRGAHERWVGAAGRPDADQILDPPCREQSPVTDQERADSMREPGSSKGDGDPGEDAHRDQREQSQRNQDAGPPGRGPGRPMDPTQAGHCGVERSVERAAHEEARDRPSSRGQEASSDRPPGGSVSLDVVRNRGAQGFPL